MFQLSLPVGELLLRAVIVYAALLLLVRLSGKRTIGEFTPFDLLVVILIGESAQSGLVGGDQSIWSTLLVSATLLGMNRLVSIATSRSGRALKLLEGEPVVLARGGRAFDRALRANHIARADLDESIRRANLHSLEEVDLAMLETSGEITIVPRST